MALFTKSRRGSSAFRLTTLAAVVSALSAGGVMAQEPEGSIEEVLVTGSPTGTMLRGVAPVGTNVVSVDKAKIEATGVSNSNDLLAQIPQVSSTFNGKPTMTSNVGAGFPMPKLRDLGVSGGSTTLILMNGLRLPGSGIIQTVPDSSVIPPGAIDRVEVVLDGGSSIYGSDAIGGVINFITRDRFEGAELQIEGDSADSYTGSSINLTVGNDWGSGSGFVSLYHTQNDAIYGRDRDYITADSSANAPAGQDNRSYYCGAGAFMGFDGVMREEEGGALADRCDQTDPISFVPETEAQTVYASLNQAITDSIDLDLVTFYSERSVDVAGHSGNDGMGTGYEALYFNYPPAADFSLPLGQHFVNLQGLAGAEAVHNESSYDSFSFMPEFTIALPDDWRLKVAYNYGEATTKGIERDVNPDPSVLHDYLVDSDSVSASDLLDYYQTNAKATQTHHQVRAVVDGDLFSLPAGEVKVATGVEFVTQNYKGFFGAGPYDAVDYTVADTDRDISSAFVEFVAPIFDNSAGVMNATASGRFDDYSDVGNTSNPKIGIDWAPVESLKFRAQWGTSFQAPSMADSGGALDKRAIYIPVPSFIDPSDENPTGQTILLAGGTDGLKPESSESYSIGARWTPEFSEGFSVDLSYFNTEYKDAITVAPFWTPLLYSNPSLSSFYTKSPDDATTRALLEGYRLQGVSSVDEIVANPVYIIIDATRKNMQAVNISGIDFDISKIWDTSFGSVNAGVAGIYYLNRETAAAEGSSFNDDLESGQSGEFDFVASLGLSTDALTTGIRVLYSDGWNDGFAYDASTTVNYYGSYNFGEQAMFEDVTLTFNVDNLLDEDPNFYPNDRGFNPPSSNIIGRMFSLGLKVKM